MSTSLIRRTLAEAVGSAALVAVVVGSGLQATELSRDVGVQLLANSLATVFGLGVLLALFGPVSGAHFNPAVTLVAWFTGRRVDGGFTVRDVAAYVSCLDRMPRRECTHRPVGEPRYDRNAGIPGAGAWRCAAHQRGLGNGSQGVIASVRRAAAEATRPCRSSLVITSETVPGGFRQLSAILCTAP